MKSKTKAYRIKYWKNYRIRKLPYKKFVCKKCRKDFKPTGNRQIICPKCKYLICQECNKKFIPDAHYSRKFCSLACRFKSQSWEEPHQLKKNRHIKPRTYHLTNPNKRGIFDIEWRNKVFERDNYTCVLCGKTKCYLEADHIKPYSKYPDLRLVLSNGRTLCLDCHKKTPTYGNRKK